MPEEDRFDRLLGAMLSKPGPDEVVPEAVEGAEDEEA